MAQPNNFENSLDSDDPITVLRNYYKKLNQYHSIQISYTRTNVNPFQSYNYLKPDSLSSFHQLNIDFDQRAFHAYRNAAFPGDFKFELKEFQNQKQSVRFDVNGIMLGKEVVTQDSRRINEVIQELDRVLDFRICHNLFSSFDLHFKILDNKDIVILKADDPTEYKFGLTPIRLLSIKTEKEEWTFEKLTDINCLGNFNAVIVQNVNDVFKNKFIVKSLVFDLPLRKEELFIPQGYTLSNETISTAITRIAKNLYLIPSLADDRNVLLHLTKKGITVLGAPISTSVSEQVLAKIKNRFPDVRINYVYVTHAHSDHIKGLAPYIEREIPIIADRYTREAILKYPAFLNLKKIPKFYEIKDGVEFNKIKFYQVENMHSKGQTFAYFPMQKIIYEGDFLHIPKDNTIPIYKPKVVSNFLNYLKITNLKIKKNYWPSQE